MDAKRGRRLLPAFLPSRVAFATWRVTRQNFFRLPSPSRDDGWKQTAAVGEAGLQWALAHALG